MEQQPGGHQLGELQPRSRTWRGSPVGPIGMRSRFLARMLLFTSAGGPAASRKSSTARGAQEEHDGSADLGYLEVAELQGERALMEEVTAAPYEPETAILSDYENLWSLQLQPHNRDFSYQREQFVIYRACQRLGIPCDVVSPSADLSRYNLVFAPALHIATVELAETLCGYVRRGGHLVFGVRSGFKTESNLVTDQPLPGLFRDLVSADVIAWHSLLPESGYDLEFDGRTWKAAVWAEALAPWPGTETLATWTARPFAGRDRVDRGAGEKGSAAYWGWHPGLEQAVRVVSILADRANVARLGQVLPDGVLRVPRGQRELWFNFTDHAQTVDVGEESVIIPPRDLIVR